MVVCIYFLMLFFNFGATAPNPAWAAPKPTIIKLFTAFCEKAVPQNTVLRLPYFPNYLFYYFYSNKDKTKPSFDRSGKAASSKF